jgi:hypothetical protein
MEHVTVAMSLASQGNRKMGDMFRTEIKFSMSQSKRHKIVRREIGFMETVSFTLRELVPCNYSSTLTTTSL